MVKWSELFETLLERGVEPIFIRLLAYVYRNQEYTVKWGQHVSKYFGVGNGVRQGGICSGIFFVVYIDKLLVILRKSGFGCRIYGVFYGAMIYADDIFLLSASRTGLQEMINISHRFAAKMNLRFGTNAIPDKSKTKCIIFSQKRQVKGPIKEIVLDGNILPWVTQVKHLGHTIEADNSMSADVNQKRCTFIGKVNSLMQEFHFATPEVLLKLVQTYACNVYGANVWNLFSKESQKLFTSYNVAIRNIFNLPRTTHRYLIEPVSDAPHLYSMLLSRYVTFSKSLLENDAFEVRFLADIMMKNMRSVLGKSIVKIGELCREKGDIYNISAKKVKDRVQYAPIPPAEVWRVSMVKELLNLRRSNMNPCGLTTDEMTALLEFACTS